MNKIKLVAKVTDDLSVQDKKEKGADSGEWQIFKDNFHFTRYDFPITSVHTSLDGGDVCIDECFLCGAQTIEKMKETRRKLEEAFQFAEEIAKKQGHRITIVAHSEQSAYPAERSAIIAYLQTLFKKYPNCDLALENTCILENPTNGKYAVRSGIKPADVPKTVCYLRNIMKEVQLEHRIFTVLDVCHALCTIRCTNLLLKGITEVQDETVLLEEYFKQTAPYCKIIHFNYLENLGFASGHGTPFPDSVIGKVLALYETYIPTADLVIEIREDDYSDSKNFQNTVNQINQYFE